MLNRINTYEKYLRRQNKKTFTALSVAVFLLTFSLTLAVTLPFQTGYLNKFFGKRSTFAAGNATIRVGGVNTVAPNQTFTIPVSINTDNQTISSADVLISYDRNYLILTAITPVANTTTPLKTFVPVTTSNTFDTAQVVSQASQSGQIRFGAITYDPAAQAVTSAYNGTTVLANLTFKAIRSGQTPLTFSFSPNSSTDTNLVAESSTPVDILTAVSNAAITIADQLPSPWQQTDIGTVSSAGSGGYSNGVFSASIASGDIWGTTDSFHYIYQPMSTDGQVIARVESITNTANFAKAGIMIRQSLTADSMNAFMGITYNQGVTFQARTVLGGTTGPGVVNAPQAERVPYWVKLIRAGSTFTGYASPDGNTWAQIGSATVPMTGTIYTGLAVASNNTGAVNTATFSNVAYSSLNPTTIPTSTVVPTNAPDTTKPTVSIVSPSNGAIVNRGSVLTIQAAASDTGGVASVEFLVNGALLCTDTSAAYTCAWSVPGKPNTTYTITAKAYDTVGNTASTSITVKSSK
jgi:regulation of enolase protein 1 (concanavalin A-like superfamily)